MYPKESRYECIFNKSFIFNFFLFIFCYSCCFVFTSFLCLFSLFFFCLAEFFVYFFKLSLLLVRILRGKNITVPLFEINSGTSILSKSYNDNRKQKQKVFSISDSRNYFKTIGLVVWV